MLMAAGRDSVWQAGQPQEPKRRASAADCGCGPGGYVESVLAISALCRQDAHVSLVDSGLGVCRHV